MAIRSITHSIPSISSALEAQAINKPHQFPRDISLRLRTLNLLSHRTIGEAAPLFCKIIYYLDQPKSTISYQTCEELFEDAFIKEFSSDEIDLFLSSFFKKFDSNQEFIHYENLKEDGKQFLWEEIIKYYCHEYIHFDTQALSLEMIFNTVREKYDPENNVINKFLVGFEKTLEKRLDLAVDIIPKFSGDELVEMKLLLITYSALLISALKKVEETKDPNLILDTGFTIKDLFEEIYALLLELPFLPPIEVSGLDQFHQSLDGLDPALLKEKFLQSLIGYILDSQDPIYEKNAKAVYETMSNCYFLDFEYKDFLQNIYRATR